MKNLTNLIVFLILSMSFTSELFSSSLIKKVEKPSKKIQPSPKMGQTNKKKYNLEEVTDILKLSKLITFNLDHDIHLYKIMKISQKAENLDGAVFVLIESKTKLGYALDDDEVDLIIRISKLDTELYQNVMNASKEIGKKITTVKEHIILSREIEKGNGRYLFKGIELSTACNYKIENDFFTKDRLQLLIKLGKINDEDRLLEIHDAMKKVGMSKKVNSKGLKILYKIYNLKGDVAYQIGEYLRGNRWKSRKQPGEREYIVIRDMMKSMDPANNQTTDIEKVQVLKKKPVSKKKKRKKTQKAKRDDDTFNSCSDYIKKD